MKLVATLIANPEHANLTSSRVDQIQTLLSEAGQELSSPFWLNQNISCDIAFEGEESSSLRRLIYNLISKFEIDCVIQPVKNRRKRLLLADMDSTIITGETLDELAAVAGQKIRVTELTERAMRGEIDFKEALRERVAILKGLPISGLEETLDKIKLTGGAHKLVKTMRANGAYTVLVSGGFNFFTDAIREELGFHEDHSNKLIVEKGVLTGSVSEPILDRESKLEKLHLISSNMNIPLDATLATGDGANDLPMIMAAGLGVSFHGKPIVEEKAPAAIRYGDLTSLLYIQGYSREEFIE